MNNRWFMRIVALLLALMLFMSVSFETQPKSSSPSVPTDSSKHVETLADVPVTTYYDEEKTVVSGVPETVNVVLEGKVNVTKTEALQRDIEVYAELMDLGKGTHKVELKYRNVSKNINVTIEPSIITATIKEKVTVEYPVEIEFINMDKIAEGYVADTPIVKPNIVKLTGAKEDMDQIALIKALVDLKDVSETVVQEARVAVYDKNQNALSVIVEPSIVEITVPISSPSKKVPFKIVRKGSVRDGLSIQSIESIPNEVTIYGSQKVLDGIEFIDGVSVDLGEVTEDTTLDVKIPLPEGIEKISPETIQIEVDVEEEKRTTLSNLPIQSFGLGEGLSLQFLTPETGTLDVSLLGAQSILDKIKPSDIELYINVTNLGSGEHDVSIEVNGPQNISWELPNDEVEIVISEEE